MKTNLLPVRDFKLAIAHTTVWMFAFWLAEYPIDDWAVTVVILYVSLWLSGAVVSTLIRSAESYTRRVAQKAGVEIRENSPSEYSTRDMLLIVVSGLLVGFTIVGLSLIVGIPVVSIYGLTPLPFYFNWVAWGLLLVGGFGVFLMFGLVVWWLSSAEAGIDAAIGSEPARKVANRQPTELELRLLFLPLLFLFLLYQFHLQSGRRSS